MTVETKIIVGLGDIVSVQLECKKCKAKVVRSPDVTLSLPHSCGQCGTTWRLETEEFGKDPVAVQLMKTIGTMRHANESAFEIKFEIDGKFLK